MTSTRPLASRPKALTRQRLSDPSGFEPQGLLDCPMPLLDWIASELAPHASRPSIRRRDQARQLLEQAFADIA